MLKYSYSISKPIKVLVRPEGNYRHVTRTYYSAFKLKNFFQSQALNDTNCSTAKINDKKKPLF